MKEKDKSLMPEWMKKVEDADEAERLKREVAAKDQTIAALRVSRESGEFWKAFLEKIQLQIQFLSPVFRLEGTMHVSDSPNNEVVCRVEVFLRGLIPMSAYVNLFYRSGGSIVRYHPQFGKHADYEFGVVAAGDVVLCMRRECHNPEQAATEVIQDLVRTVKPDAKI